ncbi:methyl-accepting chemotaxis protein (MCP) signaling protein [Motilibacter rhizosphaerae]|uniref:Methyl-accepting chemotaxis protein (MCP) signaling protein n=1 Tax=Motilibacter rhizosphaerae TaxID=598652 RepID=A0A4Q7NWP1_9ACTN|nr:methyl-accepting chemotaxis protein [Motilibacter rhizosphaerae]RZS91731.1 methyl-accepting chemotaxis protein (MCP) signaling protein [Motilibacter rhizosphaerae]
MPRRRLLPLAPPEGAAPPEGTLPLVAQHVVALEAEWREVLAVGTEMLQESETSVTGAIAAASSADDLAASVELVAAAIAEMSATVAEIERNAEGAAGVTATGAALVQQADGRIKRLQEGTAAIEQAASLIGAVARRTHILALNATIEAGRDLASSRTFTTVANEVKDLAGQTASATRQVADTIASIKQAADEVVDLLTRVTTVLGDVDEHQRVIRGTVRQQVLATEEIHRSSGIVATSARELTATVTDLTDVLRHNAYAGARAKIAAAHLAFLQGEAARLLPQPVAPGGAVSVVPAGGVVESGGVVRVQNFVRGSRSFEFDYKGTWIHAFGNVEADGADSFSSIPGDTARFRFTGRRIRLFGVRAQNHGRLSVGVDGGPAVVVDEYAERRIPASLLWESPLLEPGEHRMLLTVLGESSPASSYCWVTVDHVEVVR